MPKNVHRNVSMLFYTCVMFSKGALPERHEA